MHENAAVREWLVACDVTVKFSLKSVPSIPRVQQHAVNIKNELCPK